MKSAPTGHAARPYGPYGVARELMYSQAPEVVLAGPAGTGKSRACLEKLHLQALRHPGMRGLIVRKTRASLTESALVTFEHRVVPEADPVAEGAGRANRHAYRYANGSELVVAGLDRPSRVMSTEYDVIYVQEAIELTEDDWETLSTRLRNGRMPYQQIIADTNPSMPAHWLRRRAQAGKCLMLESRHEDNPLLWDALGGRWTPEGERYIARLDALTGTRKERLRYGRWCGAEGMVYEEWNPCVHVVSRLSGGPTADCRLPTTDCPSTAHCRLPTDGWRTWWVVDFGYTNPFVWQLWAEDPDGRLYLTREIYRTGRLVEDHAREILALSAGEPPPQGIICDHDAEGRGTLERHLGQRTMAAWKSVSPGIEAVKARLRPAGDGRPRLFVLEDALAHPRDPALDEARRPCSSLEEIEGYIWDRTAHQAGEAPLKENDHGMDCWRYLVARVDRLGNRPFIIG